jgi:hypothetical protein
MKARSIHCLFIASAISTAAATTLMAQSAVYRWTDQNGVVHFGDAPPDAATGVEAQTITLPDVQTSFRPLPQSQVQPVTTDSTQNAGPAPTQTADSSHLPSPRLEQCSDPSPIVGTGQDLYDFDAQSERLEPHEVDLFRRVVSAMRGRWRGPDNGFYCLERGEIDEKRPFDRTIEAEGDLDPPDRFVLDSTIQMQGSNRRELLRIEVRDEKLFINSGTASLLNVSERELKFGYKLQVGGVVTEYYWRIALAGTRGMTLQQWTYTQGELSASSDWKLTKGR